MVYDKQIQDFFKSLNKLDDKDYFKFMISYLAAPTLFSSKPAALLSFSRVHRNLYKLWEQYENMVRQWYRVEYRMFKEDKDVKVVFFYNRQNLKSALEKDENRNYLTKLGYNNNGSMEELLEELRNRFQKSCPHEIGIFLGIPLIDTLEFIENKGKEFKYCGYWKVYDNLEDAISIFESFDAARLKVVNQAEEELINI